MCTVVNFTNQFAAVWRKCRVITTCNSKLCACICSFTATADLMDYGCQSFDAHSIAVVSNTYFRETWGISLDNNTSRVCIVCIRN